MNGGSGRGGGGEAEHNIAVPFLLLITLLFYMNIDYFLKCNYKNSI